MTADRSPRLRWIALTVLALWMAPGAGALAVGLHLALGHHHPHGHAPHGDDDHGTDHQSAALELALATVHGHDHGAEAVPHHEHPAPVGGGPIVLSGSSATDGPVPGDSAPQTLSAVLERPPSPRRDPPVPLFEAHCSLLL